MDSTVFPNATSFTIGDVNQTTSPVGSALFQGNNSNLLFGIVKNSSTANMTFSVQQSNDNGATDLYASNVINIRVGGSAVASVVVVPGGTVVFSIETLTKPWIQFSVTPQPGATGTVTIWTPLGNLEVFGQTGYAYTTSDDLMDVAPGGG